MTELSALNIKITGDASGIKAAATTAETALGGVQRAANGAGAASDSMSGAMARGGKVGGGFAQSMRGVSQQLSQVGQQTMATGNFVQALAIQLPDLGLAFGAVGAAAGLAAGLALPLVISALSSTTPVAAELATALENLTEKTLEYRLAIGAMELGIPKEEVLIAKELESLKQELILLEYARQEANNQGSLSMAAQSAALSNQIRDLEKALAEYRSMREAAEALAAAQERQARVTKSAYQTYADTRAEGEKIAQVLGESALAAQTLSDVQFANITTAAGLAAVLRDNMRAAAAAFAITQGGQALGRYGSRGTTDNRPVTMGTGETVSYGSGGGFGGFGGGGGAGGVDLEALQRQIMSQEELQIEAYARQQETLQTALDQRLVTTEQYNAMLEQAQRQHGERMSQIDVYRYGTGLQQAGAFFGDMANALQGGNEKMAAISKKFAAAEALTNAWRAFSQTLADPSIPFWGKFAAGAKVLAAGMGAVNAIRGGGRSGASSASAATAAQQPQQAMQSLNFNITGGMVNAESFIRDLASQINAAQRNGVRLNVGVTS